MYRKYLFFDLDGTLTDSMPGITRSVRYALERLGIDTRFELISGSSLDGSRTTKAEVIGHALRTLGITPEEAVMIGDRHHDIEGAAATGLAAIGVRWGYAPEGELEAARPAAIADDIDALRRLLLEGLPS